MELDATDRYRSRVLREMNANRINPFNSPPSSTGSHGGDNQTMSSIFSDPDGESTRKLAEDIARVTAPRQLPINLETAHQRWPEYFGKPTSTSRHTKAFSVDDTQPFDSESKENRPPTDYLMDDGSTQNTWQGSKRTRQEMQARVDSDADLSSILSRSPARHSARNLSAKTYGNPSPLAKVRTVSPAQSTGERSPSIAIALDRLRKASLSPPNRQADTSAGRTSPRMVSSAKSSLTAVPSPNASMASPNHNASHVRSFFMPDVSHLGDFVTGTLRFSGSNRNGVPIFVKHGRVQDRHLQSSATAHAEIDGLHVPADEEKIFVSMDMIREEIVSLQEHYDKIEEYAQGLQREVERLEADLKTQKTLGQRQQSNYSNDQIKAQKNQLEVEVATLQARLEQMARKSSLDRIENESISQERDRVVRRLQDACDDINQLTRKLGAKERELETSHKQIGATLELRDELDTLRRNVVSLKQDRDSLKAENQSLKETNEGLRQNARQSLTEAANQGTKQNRVRTADESLIIDNRSLRSHNKSLVSENEDLRENLDDAQHELDAAREQVDILRQEAVGQKEEQQSLQTDNDSLVRHNEKYYEDNKILRRENARFEKNVQELHRETSGLKRQMQTLEQQLASGHPADETEENMTSAYFVPDITVKSNDQREMNDTETKEMPPPPELTSHSQQSADVTEEMNIATKQYDMAQSRDKSSKVRSKSRSRSASGKVAFSIPEKHDWTTQSNANKANKGSKRISSSQSNLQSSLKKQPSMELPSPLDLDESTGLQSFNDMTEDQAVALDVSVEIPRLDHPIKRASNEYRDDTNQADDPKDTAMGGQSSSKRLDTSSVNAIDLLSMGQDSCPALSSDARRVLDGLCSHSCVNCTVCTRIASHKIVVSSSDLHVGKKRVAVPRPIPASEREVSVEDPTIRPANSPGHALALVIKSLEDESKHLQADLANLQARYNASDKAIGRRSRNSLAEDLRTLLKRLEAKNDQIYSLYDVLEGQKAVGQVMSEEEIEMTILNITGLTVKDVTATMDQLTWEGLPEL